MSPVTAKTLTHAGVFGRRSNVLRQALPLLWIRTTAGPSIGFGHLRRMMILARRLGRVCEPCFLLHPDDIWSRREVVARGWQCSDFPTGVLNGGGLSTPAAVLIDTRHEEGLDSLISEARKWRVPVVSIHDLGLSPLPSDVVVDGSVCPGHEPPSARHYRGLRYLILDGSFERCNRRQKGTSAHIRRVVVNLGGGDSRRFFPRVLEGLRLWGRELEVTGLRGFSDWGQDALESRSWAPVRFRWARPIGSPASLFLAADLAVTAGGLAAYEAICAGAPLMALSYDEFQGLTISELSKRDVCIDLGRGDALQPQSMPALLDSCDRDRTRREAASRAGMALVDGKGAMRVAGIIRKLIHRVNPRLCRATRSV